MTGVTVDGNDVLEVKKAVEEAIKKARKGEPGIVELMTYRWRGHFEGDPCHYRDAREVEEAMRLCPIKRMERVLLDRNILNGEQVKKIHADVQERIEEAFRYAEGLPLPTPEETLDLDMVYATNLGGVLE